MKDLFKPKPRTLNPTDLVRETRGLLMSLDLDSNSCNRKKADKMVELGKHLLELKSTIYGRESEPVPDACSILTQEFFKGDTLRLLIHFLPKLNLEARKDATQVVANLQRQQVNFRLIASDYLEANKDLVDLLMAGYEDMDIALHYGAMFRECIRHQNIARYVLDTEHIKKFFDYIQLPNYEIASDAFSTFKEIMTRHRSTVAEFLESNYDWFCAEFNSKLLESSNYITRRLCVKLLGDILQHRSSLSVMMRYVSSNGNLKISMNLLKESNTSIPVAAFDVFKLFVTNDSKPREIVCLLSANRNKLLKFLTNFKLEKDTEESILKQFEADKTAVITEIEALQPLGNHG